MMAEGCECIKYYKYGSLSLTFSPCHPCFFACGEAGVFGLANICWPALECRIVLYILYTPLQFLYPCHDTVWLNADIF